MMRQNHSIICNNDDVKCDMRHISGSYKTELSKYMQILCCAQLPLIYKKHDGSFCGGLPRHV